MSTSSGLARALHTEVLREILAHLEAPDIVAFRRTCAGVMLRAFPKSVTIFVCRMRDHKSTLAQLDEHGRSWHDGLPPTLKFLLQKVGVGKTRSLRSRVLRC